MKPKKISKNHAGQYTIISLVYTFVLIIVYTRLYPTIKAFIDEATPSMTALDATILSLIPFFLLLVIVLSALWYVVPRRYQD